MNKIVRINEKVLDHLIKLRETNSDLFFVPRKINNKNRLDDGYWFLGNEHYLHISFWNGTDWKEKIHNIGFVILDNKKSYIELSAQDSKEKAKFLKTIASQIKGLKKYKNKDKWYKNYSGTDYIKNLDDFINNVKPLIDNLIRSENPIDISLPTQQFFNKYSGKVINLRKKQIEIGNNNKFSRICWNTENWKFPSGSKGKSISTESYESETGFGHEEWLFDKSRVIDGFHYAFLQPLLLKSNKHYNKSYNISLFTINNLNKRYYVGKINNVKCISREESENIYKIYKTNGWLSEMKNDVERVGANWEKFLSTEPEILFNIKFKFDDLEQPDELIEIDNGDINITTHRYKLLPEKTAISFGVEIENDEEFSEGNKKNTKRRKTVFNSDCEYDPYHDQMQNAIFELLKTDKYDYRKVFIEKNRVDIKAITENGIWHYFELKTDNPKLSIRKAIGQIMEYAYYPETEKAEKLIIISDKKPNRDTINYLKHIRNKFDLPVTYRSFDLEKNELSDDY